jgi:hypothetical protein
MASRISHALVAVPVADRQNLDGSGWMVLADPEGMSSALFEATPNAPDERREIEGAIVTAHRASGRARGRGKQAMTVRARAIVPSTCS